MDHSLIQKSNSMYRIVPFEQTYQHVLPLMDIIGADPAVDLTGYGTLSIPAHEIKIDDYSVYGKGVDRLQSQVSAMMEAIERYSARYLPRSALSLSYTEMSRQHQVLKPEDITGAQLPLPDDVSIEWLPGTDLLSNTTVWIPACYALLKPALSGPPILKRRTSNGLASGNTLDEAVCYALYELIERDAWTLAWLQAVTIPQMRHMAQHIQYCGGAKWDSLGFLPHVDGFPLVNVETLPGMLRDLISMFEDAGMTVRIRNITSDVRIPTFMVYCHDENSSYYGMGTHLNSVVALIRAITECAQIYHVKKYTGTDYCNDDRYIEKMKHIMMMSGLDYIEFDGIASKENNNIKDDIDMIVSNLSKIGINKIIVIDLSHQELDIPVVRVIAPGLEDWSVHNFSPDYCSLGYRGKRYVAY